MSKMRMLYGQQFLFVVFFTCVVCVTSQSYAGETCFHNAQRVNGICKQVNLCETAKEDLKKRIYPQQCGFEVDTILVCCVEKATTTSTTTTTGRPVVTGIPSGTLPVGEKSKRACKEYEKLAYKRQPSPVVTDDGFETVPNCPWEPGALTVISEGENATKGEFPHMALIGYGTWPNDYSWSCGGSLISDKFVLTAGHCLNQKKLGKPTFVRLGDINYAIPDDDQDVQQINIKLIHKYPQYDSFLNYHDIALLELEKPASLNIFVKPICLYTSSKTENLGIITGWGNTENNTKSENLLKTVVSLFGYEQCKKSYANRARVLPRGLDGDTQICYGSNRNRKDTCPGDSGGPIQIHTSGAFCSYSVFGVTSFGAGKSCGNNIPGVYVKVSSYIEWIESKVWPS